MGQTPGSYLIFETAAGFCGIGWTEAGIARFHLPVTSAEAAERSLLRRFAGASNASTPPPAVLAVVDAARRYFDGERIDFSGVRVDLHRQGDFFRRVYAAIKELGWGETTTYGALAKALGAGPEAARDVGEAMAKNPVPLIIPCHRVLAAGGKLGGFSAPGGSATKRKMLEMEGVRLAPAEPAQGSLAL